MMATGPLSAAMTPNFPGLDTFAGEIYHTAHWPHQPVDFTGKRVAVIGTGSSGIQSIPIIAEQADAPLRLPAHAELQRAGGQRRTHRRRPRRASRPTTPSGAGCRGAAAAGPRTSPHPKLTMEATAEERREAFEKRWQLGGVLFSKTFPDQMTDMAANEEARKFYEEKVRGRHRRSGCRRAADSQRPSDRHQANLHRHQLLSDLQQAPRDAGRASARHRSSRSTPRASTPPTRITTSTRSFWPPDSTQ